MREVVTAAPLDRLAATMGWERPTDRVPPLWHWLFAQPTIPRDAIGPDGHERLGLFLPSFPGALRMWAGSTIRFIAPLRVNDMVEVQTTIADVVEKTTPRQRLRFVTLRHEYRNDAGPVIEDVQTLVYRVQIDGARTQEPAEKAPVDETILATFRLNDTDLFRYCAVTFNSHRIHLDRSFCQAELGTPRLVVHGPLLATIAARAAATVLSRELTAFSFRARRPIFEGEEFIVALVASAHGECTVTIRGTDGSSRLEATAES